MEFKVIGELKTKGYKKVKAEKKEIDKIVYSLQNDDETISMKITVELPNILELSDGDVFEMSAIKKQKKLGG